MADHRIRLAYAGDRDVAVDVLRILLETGDEPVALLLSDQGRATHDTSLLELCHQAGAAPLVLRGSQLKDPAAVARLRDLNLDYLLSVHFPYLLSPAVLETARQGALNLHPAYLPYNRGWHTPTWAILDNTPAGASLHYMVEGLDAGDIVCQERVAIDPADTAHTLYAKLKALEVEVFRRGWSRLRAGDRRALPQNGAATLHRRDALFDPAVQRIDLAERMAAGDLLRRLRALTTNRLEEAAYFESGDRRYRVQVVITPEVGR